MSQEYWRAKIWGLLHDPILKALHNDTGRGENSFYQQLEVMQPWVETGKTPEESTGGVLENILLADYIASASDRGAIGSVTASIDYAPSDNLDQGLEIAHLLSGEKQQFKIQLHAELIESNRQQYLLNKEHLLLEAIPKDLREEDIKHNVTKIKKLYWWLWRCLPQATCNVFNNDNSLMLMPAEARLPDASIWSHVSITSALAGGLAGYDLTTEEVQNSPSGEETSHPYLAVFSFSPVQELIKSSRRMRDFWAGSWLLHYLSAKVSWELANQYGPDSLVYPSLYQQPLIDHWLRQKYPEFETWISQPTSESLLTAGFPNVLVLILPKDKVKAAMETARQTLMGEWQNVYQLVFEELEIRHWMPKLNIDNVTWSGWLKSQWQFYWTGLPIGKIGEGFTISADETKKADFDKWVDAQNQAYGLTREERKLFKDEELNLLQEAYKQCWKQQKGGFSANVGSWWGYIFDATRYALASVKNARNWELPTAFAPRSTVSGIGSVVNHNPDGKNWIGEGETKKLWSKKANLFNGKEQLNATETVKRGLPKVLHKLLSPSKNDITVSYPDLTSGVAGYLKVNAGDSKHQRNFVSACQNLRQWILQNHNQIPDAITENWGIPWVDNDNQLKEYHSHHPRLLNAGWLVEDLDIGEDLNVKNQTTQHIQQIINSYYPKNNPSNWYVLAAGDGDGMSDWLKGTKLKKYGDYIPSNLSVELDGFQNFLQVTKRMGPSTHSALSRALLDFSNALVPYLTEKRYAGRLIYSGGDDVLAYTNLWEWDDWLWDIRQCFKGAEDPRGEFNNNGGYWQYRGHSTEGEQVNFVERPLFTMGREATISFGIVVAHHSVPLAIALESLWEAEQEAKQQESPEGKQKDAVQVRVLYGNGNTLKCSAKFDVFHNWQKLITKTELDSAIFEQAASLWSQHPAPNCTAMGYWTQAFCARRDQFQGNESVKNQFQTNLVDFLQALFTSTKQGSEDKVKTKNPLDAEIENWLKLAAFIKRHRNITLGGDI
ncbi:type III-B CRISPR-associated protein Cas10/Cmr2 [Umezakia ovalisporum]|uniref:Type III-B CRISPR-associated protein Cas10/Cmr2 n=1 Tax=Umezakia ovalisporum FSS-62 TaxID=2971776 RepID=A0AA43GYC4_9CYAN|nr:type III-B CRISPR-associated protein Cas10/Cmr2 [Umezakia ovalisporum]MDH6063108.1 type III-B CRISPR-associated protein Cas10/Cmr2 [Umezakia ovalisporum FSS-62]MDH6103760.1 type III-B CRISPR-associated protein Cas10/Cmr2 [Umezakia ovalisporum ANA283AFssAo]